METIKYIATEILKVIVYGLLLITLATVCMFVGGAVAVAILTGGAF